MLGMLGIIKRHFKHLNIQYFIQLLLFNESVQYTFGDALQSVTVA